MAWIAYGPVFLAQSGDGWDYQVIADGRVQLRGWVRGSKREARAAAEEHAREKGLTIDG